MPPPRDEAAPAAPTILVVDDERNIRRTLDLVLRGDGYDVLEAGSAEKAVEILEGGGRPVDLLILDINLPGMSGIDLLSRLREDEATRGLPAIVISGTATVQDAVQALKLGAADFFEKPLGRERVLVSVRNALQASELRRELSALSAEVEARRELVGRSAVVQKLRADIARVAPTRANVLVTGESGTGKELVARAVHQQSRRVGGPFIRVSCAAISRDIMESELFGHVKGSFTNATSNKRGFFEQAHGGTLFLDDIGEMDPTAQTKVLRAVQAGEVTRVGGEQAIRVDVRVISATSRDLVRESAAGRFREDLYFRLAVFPLQCPSLAERTDDVRLLADAFLAGFCRENGLRPRAMAGEVYAALERRRWPGNVRELRNVIERAAILAGDVVTIADLPEDPHASPFEEEPAASEAPHQEARPSLPQGRPTLAEFRAKAEREYVTEVLRSVGWNVRQAADVLGVERTTLHHRIRALRITRPEGVE